MTLPSIHAPDARRDNLVLALAAVLQLAVLAWDVATPLGRTEWVFHLLPVTLLLLQQRRWPPALLVLTAWLALALGFVLSPNLGVNAGMAAGNRAIGGFNLAAVAAVLTLVLNQRREMRRILWVQQGKVTLSQQVAGEGTPEQVGQRIVAALCQVSGARIGALYRVDAGRLRLCAALAAPADGLPAELPLHGGLPGQVLQDQRVQAISPAPAGHLPLQSALGHSQPAHLVLMPVRAEGAILGVAELGFVGPAFDAPLVIDLCERSAELLGLALRAAVYRRERQYLLEDSQRQAEELQVQQEELRLNNEELEAQGRLLRDSQAALEAEHEALSRSNARLEVQAQSLELQKAALQRTQGDLLQRTEALAAASRYKSEFLANMSHELRTPLNSALILSRLLVDNREATLSAEQVRYAQAIHDANQDLLALINDILDLSKVEAGHAELRPATLRLSDLQQRLRSTFEPLARDKHLALAFTCAADAPDTLITDGQRLQQVLGNLLANALKFTRQGSVALHIGRADGGRVRFEVTDTGLGIAADQHQLIFEAFRQADGSTSRQFGGTGLGLSISRELVQRMGGEIGLCSAPGQGSTFTVLLPLVMPAQPEPAEPAALPAPAEPAALPAQTAQTSQTGLVNPAAPAARQAAHPAAHLAAHQAGAVQSHGDNPAAAQGPPGPPPLRQLLVVEGDAPLRDSLQAVLAAPQRQIHTAGTVAEALALLAAQRFDCMVTDLSLPDGRGDELLERLAGAGAPPATPVIVHTGRALSGDEELRLRRHACAIVVKSARSPERLLDEVNLQLHGAAPWPPPDGPQRLPARTRERDAVLAGRTVLLAEDDVRNLFALTSVFEAQGVRLVLARHGREALDALARQPGIDLVLMDIMMPVMDGLEAIRRIRAQPEWAALPIIALTAKAMADDRQQCLAAGASDYLAKPIDAQRLLSLCRVWMPQ
ncbi:hybrid sensor histidine kinase/response regulator [Aquabacterium sp. OR-4]|uniref:hybrid sensor histidine kinase/response regulator n=1 Tax=Aquabacterium sp. OR-4 TaxID=2978127 RepID=UPI0021B168FE|nr:response regulator [Aquabacterium sp. OR-4]MDT7835091.1 response regulator [Aquabacterium sp. OR-4]